MSQKIKITRKPGSVRGGVTVKAVEDQAQLLVTGRLDRAATEAAQLGMYLPAELRERIELLQLGGGISGAIIGLLAFALDEVEARRLSLRVDLGG